MDNHHLDIERRKFLKGLLAFGVVAGAGGEALVRSALAMAPQAQQFQGMQKVEGTVLINGSPAQEKVLVLPGDTISTGLASQAVFVAGRDAFLLRASSRVELEAPVKPKVVKKVKSRKRGAKKEIVSDEPVQKDSLPSGLARIKILSGKMLAVFGEGERRIETPTATAVAGRSALYIEASPDVTYLCCCYGKAVVEAKAYPGKRASLEIKYHEEPYYVLSGGWKRGFLRAPLMNHNDDELALLESLVDRAPLYSSGAK